MESGIRGGEVVRAEHKNCGFGLYLTSDNQGNGDFKSITKAINDMRFHPDNGLWNGLLAIPPGSFIEAIVADFQAESSVALPLPVMMSFVYLSSYLCQQGIKIDFAGREEWPTLWICLLADSGGAKTFTLKFLREMFGEIDYFDNFSSSKEFVEKLVEMPNALWIQDEFGPFFKSIKEQTYLAETDRYLLKIYDNDPITRNTGGETREIAEPVLNILGSSATKSFFKDFDARNFITGLAQRFLWVWVEKPEQQKAIWKVRKQRYTDEIKARWKNITASIKPNTTYRMLDDTEAEKAFEFAFESISGLTPLSDDFYRRIMFAAAKSYSLIYHILLGKGDIPEIDAEDVAWATRLAYLHVKDTIRILDVAGGGKTNQLLDKIDELAKRIRKERNSDITARDIQRTFNKTYGIKTATEAKQYLEMYKERGTKNGD